MKPIEIFRMVVGAAVVISIIYLLYEDVETNPKAVGIVAGGAGALFVSGLPVVAHALGG